MLLADSAPGVPFWQDYWSVQTDPAHLLSELGFTLAFELIQIVIFALLWKKVIKPYLDRRHQRFDQEHGLYHCSDPDFHPAMCKCGPTRIKQIRATPPRNKQGDT